MNCPGNFGMNTCNNEWHVLLTALVKVMHVLLHTVAGNVPLLNSPIVLLLQWKNKSETNNGNISLYDWHCFILMRNIRLDRAG